MATFIKKNSKHFFGNMITSINKDPVGGDVSSELGLRFLRGELGIGKPLYIKAGSFSYAPTGNTDSDYLNSLDKAFEAAFTFSKLHVEARLRERLMGEMLGSTRLVKKTVTGADQNKVLQRLHAVVKEATEDFGKGLDFEVVYSDDLSFLARAYRAEYNEPSSEKFGVSGVILDNRMKKKIYLLPYIIPSEVESKLKASFITVYNHIQYKTPTEADRIEFEHFAAYTINSPVYVEISIEQGAE